MNFDFLKNIEALEIQREVKPKGIKATPKNPTGMKLRIFKSGEVYPSTELVEQFNLEYNVEGANGFDVIDSREWGQMPKVDGQGNPIPAMLFFAITDKNLPKVDLFGAAKLENTSVLTQGSKRPEFVQLLKEVYGEDIFQNKNYVDIEVNTEFTVFPNLTSVYSPKKIVKGANKGKQSYETRENKGIYTISLVIPEVVAEELEEVENKELEETV